MLTVSINLNDCFDETSKLTVNKLRGKLDEKELDVDGSKEILVTRLNAANKRQKDE